MADDQPDDTIEATNPPEVVAETGVAMDGGYPVNHRLRAEALVADGKNADPLGHVSPDMIASTADRLAAEAKDAEARETEAEKAARALHRASLAKLRETAATEGVAIEGDANKAAIIDAIESARATSNEG